MGEETAEYTTQMAVIMGGLQRDIELTDDGIVMTVKNTDEENEKFTRLCDELEGLDVELHTMIDKIDNGFKMTITSDDRAALESIFKISQLGPSQIRRMPGAGMCDGIQSFNLEDMAGFDLQELLDDLEIDVSDDDDSRIIMIRVGDDEEFEMVCGDEAKLLEKCIKVEVDDDGEIVIYDDDGEVIETVTIEGDEPVEIDSERRIVVMRRGDDDWDGTVFADGEDKIALTVELDDDSMEFNIASGNLDLVDCIEENLDFDEAKVWVLI